MRLLQHIILWLTVLSLASCTSDSFKIDGNLTNLHGKNVRVIFRGDSGIVDERVNLDKKGISPLKGRRHSPSL